MLELQGLIGRETVKETKKLQESFVGRKVACDGGGTATFDLIASSRVAYNLFLKDLMGIGRSGRRSIINAVCRMKMDGRSGAVRMAIGSCSNAFHDNRRNIRGVNALSVVMDILEIEDVNRRVDFRFFE